VTNPTDGTYELDAPKRDWWEDYSSWNSYGPEDEDSWEIPGAKGTSDRETTVVGTITAPSTGQVTITLNAAGIDLVQSWVDDPSTNNGMLIADSKASDGLFFESRNAETARTCPKLTVT